MTEQAHGSAPEATAEVAIVGAGLAGLTVARELDRRGISVVVLESADRVGGRTRAETTVLGSRIDLGGQWVGHDHHRFIALAAELGASIYRMHAADQIAVLGGDPVAPDAAILEQAAAEVLSGWASTAQTGIPEAWKRTTVADQLRREVADPTTRRLLEVMIPLMCTADLDRYAMADWAEILQPSGALEDMMSTTDGAQDSLVLEGAGTLAERIAEALGDRVLLNHRVTSVTRRDGRTTLRTAAGEAIAEQLVIAVPPPMLARVHFDPALPDSANAHISGTYMGLVYKAIAVYERPFWRDAAEAESYLLDRPGGCVFDTSPPEGPGHLCFLIGGAEALELDGLSPEERRTKLLARLTERLGTEVQHPAGWHEKAWHLDPDVGGGYEALPMIGSAGGSFEADPAAGLFWAGTETAIEHPGYIEGALESAERVVQEVCTARGTRS